MKPWEDLGVVDTIYEEEDHECSSFSSQSVSPSLSSPPSPLHSRVEAWAQVTGCETDVLVHVQGTTFYLHKYPLSARSGYLRRQLTERSELTLPPTFKITAKAFSIVADFCYGTQIPITPFNVAELRLAAELLQMTEQNGGESLVQITETSFRRIVAANGEYALIVFRSCLPLLPEAETAVFMVSRCLEAICMTEDGEGVDCCFLEFISLRAQDFKIVAESIQRRFTRHDALYRIVDCYIQENGGKLSEEERNQICNFIDCNRLSQQHLLHAVQNPRMPLRFIVRAMLVEQLNTRRSIYSAVKHRRPTKHGGGDGGSITLGAILQRDAAVREAVHLRAVMSATSSRIENLEKQLTVMKTLLLESEKERVEASRSIMGGGRSASFHYDPRSRIEKGDRRTASSASFRLAAAEERGMGSSSSDYSPGETPRTKRNIGQRLIKGLKSAFWVSNSSTRTGSNKAKTPSNPESEVKDEIRI